MTTRNQTTDRLILTYHTAQEAAAATAAALAEVRERHASAEGARSAYGHLPADLLLELNQCELADLQATNAVAEASAALAVEIDAQEIAARDKDMLLAGRAPLAKDLAALLDEAAALRARAAEKDKEAAARLASAREAFARVAARRAAASLPAPAPIPAGSYVSSMSGLDTRPAAILEALGKPPVFDPRAGGRRERMGHLERDVNRALLDRAEARRKAEEARKAREAEQASRERDKVAEQARQEQLAAESRAKLQAEAAERQRIIDGERSAMAAEARG